MKELKHKNKKDDTFSFHHMTLSAKEKIKKFNNRIDKYSEAEGFKLCTMWDEDLMCYLWGFMIMAVA